jgi:hypothetical protein
MNGTPRQHVPCRITEIFADEFFQPSRNPILAWHTARAGSDLAMQESQEVQCPYCGQGMELVIDTTIAQQRFTTDCEVCCRPFEVFAECEPGEILSLEVQA